MIDCTQLSVYCVYIIKLYSTLRCSKLLKRSYCELTAQQVNNWRYKYFIAIIVVKWEFILYLNADYIQVRIKGDIDLILF